jgi:hypothetical protein
MTLFFILLLVFALYLLLTGLSPVRAQSRGRSRRGTARPGHGSPNPITPTDTGLLNVHPHTVTGYADGMSHTDTPLNFHAAASTEVGLDGGLNTGSVDYGSSGEASGGVDAGGSSDFGGFGGGGDFGGGGAGGAWNSN